MSSLAAIGTYLPGWENSGRRVVGADEDAVTMAVAAGRALLTGLREDGGVDVDVTRVVLVSRDLPLLEGGNSAALLAGLGLTNDLPVVEQVGGGPAALDLVATAMPGTLVLAADLEPAGAGAALVAAEETRGAAVDVVGRVTRSLPISSRGRDGVRWEYDDPRLMLERGTKTAIDGLGLAEKPDVIAGLAPKPTRLLSRGGVGALPTTGASSAMFALAEAGPGDVVVATEQATAVGASVARAVPTFRDEVAALPVPRTRTTQGPDIGISLPAYERAFEAKLRWEAGSCDVCGHLAMPPRLRCTACGSEDGWSLTPLPRTGEVYTKVDIHVPVPGRATPYSLAIVQLDGTDVRVLVSVTGAPSGTVEIGDRGRLVLRLVDTRSGVPDYGHALRPEVADQTRGEST